MDLRSLSRTSVILLKAVWITASILHWASCSETNAEHRSYAKCDDPGAPRNGFMHSANAFLVGSGVSFSCRAGYRLRGERRLVCLQGRIGAARWSDDLPQCVPSAVLLSEWYEDRSSYHELLRRSTNTGCTDFGDVIENGFRMLLSGTSEGSIVEFGCNQGFDLDGDSRLICRQGEWSGAWPQCSPALPQAMCGDPGSIFYLFGQRFVEGTTEGSTVTYSCNKRFVLRGDAVRTCMADGQWSGSLPVCTIVTCPRLEDPRHGKVDYSSLTSCSTATYSCDGGRVLQGEPEVTCLESGIWSSGPPTCKAVRCPDLRRPSHGSVSHPRHPSYQEEATYSCDNGYGVAGRSTRVCLASGSWSGVAPTCEKGLCDELENPQNGEVSSSSNKVGADVTYSCFHGYRLIGSPKRECLASGDWSVSAPRCEPSHCSNITMPRNMHISQTNGNFVFSVATHSCPEGYILFGSAVRECQPSGIWNGQVPACFPIHCPRLLPPVNGDLTLSNRRCYRSEAVYSCRDGFELRGDMIRTCQNTSQWSGEEPSCVRVIVQCDPLPNITNGQVRVDSRDIGSVAVYSCNEGYGLDGDSLRTCTADGVWSGREPSCNIDRVVMCEALLDPAFGEVVSRSNDVGSIASYECLLGYVLSGDRTRICMRNGMWTGDPPACQPVNCGRLNAPGNGVIVVRDTTLGAVAIYTCDPSFRLVGVESRVCQENGSWSGETPICEAIDCGVLLAPANGAVDLSDGSLVGAVAIYTCDPSFRLIGVESRICQGNGSWSGEAPICEAIDCGVLLAPANGAVDLSDGSLVGAVAIYTCDPSFRLIGVESRICQENGSWSGEAPVCLGPVAIDCGVLLTPANGAVDLSDGSLVGAVAIYTCDPSFRLIGVESRICQKTGSWSGEAPVCQGPVAIDCGVLLAPANGAVDLSNGSLVGAVAIYTCDPSFRLIGVESRICQENGSWSGEAPVCEAIDCGVLLAPANGAVDLSNGSLVGDVAIYTCDPSFRLIGVESRICQGNGSWSGEAPICEAIDCGVLLAPANGAVDLSNGSLVGDVAIYTCDPSFTLIGAESRICQENGSWSGEAPVCQGPVAIDCGVLLAPANGAVDLSDGSLVDAVAIYTCDPSFRLIGVESRICQGNGSWSGETPVCLGPVAIDCGVLLAPANGAVDLSNGSLVGAVAIYTCDPSFTLIGVESRICQENGSWSGETPVCLGPVAIDCGVLLTPANGAVDLSDGSLVGAVAIYTCDPSFRLIGAESRICQKNGSWSGEAPVCQGPVAIDCGVLLAPANGAVDLSDGSLVGAVAIYTCDPSFRLIGVESRICQENGSWSGETPVCEAIDCGVLLAPANGAVDLSDGSLVGAVAIYTCDPSFRLIGVESRICQENGSWSGETPVCEAIDCGVLLAPANGAVDLSDGSLVDAVAIYTCDPSFRLIGVESRVCQENGSWSGEAPVCEVTVCSDLDPPVFGFISFESETREIGTTANHTCMSRYTLIGEPVRTCLDTGLWSGEAPICELLECPVLNDPPNGMVTVTDTIPGSIAMYLCGSGFRLEGDATRVCNRVGERAAEWSGEDPTCERIMCPLLEDPENGEVTTPPPYFVNVTAVYACDPGYELRNGSIRRVCMPDGEWSGMAPICALTRVTCPRNLNIEFGSVVIEGDATLGSMAVYQCNLGYEIVGEAVRVCELDGLVGEWSGEEPTCRVVMCDPLEEPVDGDLLPSGFSVNDTTLYICNPGFKANGPVQRRCTPTGEWSGDETVCDPEPGTLSCGRLKDPENGMVSLSSTRPDSMATYSCMLGYMLTGGDRERRCQGNGTWDGTEPTCTVVDCGPLSDPANGIVFVSVNTTLASTARYECNQGYELVGLTSEFRFCTRSGSWSEMDPTCEPVDCGFLSPPVNGVVNQQQGTEFMDVAFYSCLEGYVLMPPESVSRTCTDTGEWSNSEPTCELMTTTVDCGDLPPPPNGQVTLLNSSTGQEALAEYSCLPGYMVVGVAIRQCQATGLWDGEAPSCAVRECPALQAPVNGDVFVFGTTVNSSATYSCRAGFELVGLVRRVCQSNGEWSGEDTQCLLLEDVMCPLLASPINGFVENEDQRVGTIASYSCGEGFTLSGPQTRTCQPNGAWSETEPTCERIQCPDPGVPENGRRIGESFQVDDSVLFLCSDGFDIEGMSTLTCMAGGAWSDATPSCAPPSMSSSRFPRRGLCAGISEGEIVVAELGQRCRCVDGRLESCCRYRQEWNQLTSGERQRYIAAVTTASSDPPYRSVYVQIMQLYLQAFSDVVLNDSSDTSQFFPWHRYYLQLYEDLLRVVDSSVTIPYWDWTTHPGNPYNSQVFDLSMGFGNSVDSDTQCVNSGPFREGEFSVTPQAGGGCIRRTFSDFSFNRDMINGIISLPATSFRELHSMLQRYLHFPIRCYIGGTMCTNFAAEDPLYLLLLSQLDRLLDQWQVMDKDRALVRYSEDTSPLVHTLETSLPVKVSDYSSNKELPYGTSVCYSEPPPQSPPNNPQ